MNENKVAFIICVNNELYLEECRYYIERLSIPPGYAAETVAVRDAASMCAGYNRGMRESDAKYKVYLHQDVFIIYQDFIGEMLRIFADGNVGMVGMVGSPKLPKDGVMWSGERIGRIYTSNVTESGEAYIGAVAAPYQEVEAVDGLLIATQYDVPWREDLFKGWDFYDISQTAEFRRRGYKAVIPYMQQPWVLHDDDLTDLASYFTWRNIFLKEYGGMMDGDNLGRMV